MAFFSENIDSELSESFSAWSCPVSGSTFLAWVCCKLKVVNKGRSAQKQEHNYLNTNAFTQASSWVTATSIFSWHIPAGSSNLTLEFIFAMGGIAVDYDLIFGLVYFIGFS